MMEADLFCNKYLDHAYAVLDIRRERGFTKFSLSSAFVSAKGLEMPNICESLIKTECCVQVLTKLKTLLFL